VYIQSDILNPNLHHIKSITEDPAKNRYYNYERLTRNHILISKRNTTNVSISGFIFPPYIKQKIVSILVKKPKSANFSDLVEILFKYKSVYRYIKVN
jgi:hypothetical protein